MGSYKIPGPLEWKRTGRLIGVIIDMKKLIFTLIVTGICYHQAFAQRKLTDDELNKSTASKIKFEDTSACGNIDNWVLSDIKANTIFLFLQSGIAPVTYANDTAFEKRYSIYYNDFACEGFNDYKCIIKYDSEIFDYLTKKYGRKWMHEIRKDVIGFHEWKKSR